jgi:hypothetical protein
MVSDAYQPKRGCVAVHLGRNPFRVGGIRAGFSQGGAVGATLGFEPESTLGFSNRPQTASERFNISRFNA